MINPNRTHRLRNALVTVIGNPSLSCQANAYQSDVWCEFRSKGTTFGGWIKAPKFKLNDRVNIQVQFSIVMDKYVVSTANKPRLRKAAI